MNGHTFDDSPDEFVKMLDAEMEAVESRFCSCEGVTQVLPMSGHRWGVSYDHAPGCLSDPTNYPPKDSGQIGEWLL